MAQIAPKVFAKDLQKVLFASNDFFTKAKKDTAAANATAVQIPQSAAIDKAADGTPSFPLTVKTKTDSVKEYALEQIYCEPYLVNREEKITLTYDKVKDIVEQQGENMLQLAGNKCATNWGPASTATASIITSTGTARAVTMTGATGTRKELAKKDVLNVKKVLQKQNIKMLSGIVGVITPDQHDDLLNIAEFVDYEKTGNETKLKEGIIGRLVGIDFMIRWDEERGNMGLAYAKTEAGAIGVKKALTDVLTDTSACPAALFFSKKHVRYAWAYPETIVNKQPAGYLGGDIIESVVRFGATANRSDGKGVVSIIETWVS